MTSVVATFSAGAASSAAASRSAYSNMQHVLSFCCWCLLVVDCMHQIRALHLLQRCFMCSSSHLSVAAASACFPAA
jgi:hypothetical protein